MSRINVNGAIVTATPPGLPTGATDGDQLEIVGGVPVWNHATVNQLFRYEQSVANHDTAWIDIVGYHAIRIAIHGSHQIDMRFENGAWAAHRHGVFVTNHDTNGALDQNGSGTTLNLVPPAGGNIGTGGAWRPGMPLPATSAGDTCSFDMTLLRVGDLTNLLIGLATHDYPGWMGMSRVAVPPITRFWLGCQRSNADWLDIEVTGW